MFRKILYLVAMTPILVANAEEAPQSKWSGEAELGYLRTTGNTDTESLTAKGKIVNERPKWRHTGTVEVTNKKDNEITTAKRWYLTGKSDYNINEFSYLFAMLTYEDDEFSGYDYQASGVVGYGYHVIKREDLKLDLEVGAGARNSKLANNGTNTEGVAKGAANLEWKISKTSTFVQYLSVEAGEDNTKSRSESSLKLQIVGNLAAKLAYQVRHSSNVPPGIDKTDTETIITLVYNFE